MSQPSALRIICLFISLIVLVVVLSIFSNRLWGGKPEQLPEPKEWKINEEMMLKDFAQANGLSNSVLKEIFNLKTKSDLQKKIFEYDTSEQVIKLVKKNLLWLLNMKPKTG